jgi:hypothetical protein
MRLLAFSIILILVLTGCGENVADPKINVVNPPFQNIRAFELKGHQYITFNAGYRSGVVHNPDCPCYVIRNTTNTNERRGI